MLLAFASTEKEEETSGCDLKGSSYGEEKSEETLERGARDEIAMKVNKPWWVTESIVVGVALIN